MAQILEDYGAKRTLPTILFTDSANAQKNVLNPLNSARNRHIDVRYKWVIEQVTKGIFKVDHIPGTEMVADGLTKPLGKEKHAQFVKLLGMEPIAITWASED